MYWNLPEMEITITEHKITINSAALKRRLHAQC